MYKVLRDNYDETDTEWRVRNVQLSQSIRQVHHFRTLLVDAHPRRKPNPFPQIKRQPKEKEHKSQQRCSGDWGWRLHFEPRVRVERREGTGYCTAAVSGGSGLMGCVVFDVGYEGGIVGVDVVGR